MIRGVHSELDWDEEGDDDADDEELAGAAAGVTFPFDMQSFVVEVDDDQIDDALAALHDWQLPPSINLLTLGAPPPQCDVVGSLASGSSFEGPVLHALSANHAAANPHSAVEQLQRLGANVDKAACEGEVVADLTPTWIAAQCGHVEAVEALGRLGADVNRAALDGRTPVHMAAQQGHAAAVEALGRQGADVNRASKSGWTPLDVACNGRHSAAVAVLERLGAR